MDEFEVLTSRNRLRGVRGSSAHPHRRRSPRGRHHRVQRLLHRGPGYRGVTCALAPSLA